MCAGYTIASVQSCELQSSSVFSARTSFVPIHIPLSAFTSSPASKSGSRCGRGGSRRSSPNSRTRRTRTARGHRHSPKCASRKSSRRRDNSPPSSADAALSAQSAPARRGRGEPSWPRSLSASGAQSTRTPLRGQLEYHLELGTGECRSRYTPRTYPTFGVAPVGKTEARKREIDRRAQQERRKKHPER